MHSFFTCGGFVGATVVTFRSLVRDVDRAGGINTSFVWDEWINITINNRRDYYDGSLKYVC